MEITSPGAAQPEEESESQVMVVSKEFVARQVCEVIRWREKWLDEKGLPRNTVMGVALQAEFLKASMDEYHNRPDQRELQKRDATEGGKQLVDGRKKARWHRSLQTLAAPRRCGSSSVSRKTRPGLPRSGGSG